MRVAVIGLALLSGCSAFATSPSSLVGRVPGAKSSISNAPSIPPPLRTRSSAQALTGLRGGMGEGKPKLIYFDGRGVAETARVSATPEGRGFVALAMMLLVAGADFEDFRYSVAMVDGVPSIPEFKADKEAGNLVANMGRLPLLDVGSAKFGQSHAINRYVASQNGFMGKTAEDAAIIDCLYECVRDTKEALSKLRAPSASGTPEEKKAKTEEFWKDTSDKGFQHWLNRLDETLAHFTPEDTGFAYGSSLSLIDFAIYSWIESLVTNKDILALGTKPWESCPRVNAAYDKVLATPAVAKWIEERPETMF